MTLIRAADVATESLGEEICLLRVTTGTALVLNRTAAEIWQRCDGRRVESQVVAELSEKYELPADGMAREVAQVIDNFRTHGFLLDQSALDRADDA